MKFMITDRSQKGFARHCPGIAKAYTCLSEGVLKIRINRIIRQFENQADAENNGVWTHNTSRMRFGSINILLKMLKDAAMQRHIMISRALGDAIIEEKGSTKVIGILADAIKQGADDNTVLGLCEAFEYAVKHGKCIEIVATMTELLDQEYSSVWVPWRIAFSLSRFASEGKDVTAAVPILIRLIKNGNITDTQDISCEALVSAVNQGQQEITTQIIAGLREFMDSTEFMAEVNANSKQYLEWISYCNTILGAAREKELQGAAQ